MGPEIMLSIRKSYHTHVILVKRVPTQPSRTIQTPIHHPEPFADTNNTHTAPKRPAHPKSTHDLISYCKINIFTVFLHYFNV